MELYLSKGFIFPENNSKGIIRVKLTLLYNTECCFANVAILLLFSILEFTSFR